MTTNTRPTVFVVDDDPRILKSIHRLTKEVPYDVFTFDDPQKALAELEKKEVAVVVSDQMMPVMTGTVFLERVKEKWPDTIRIILSGVTDFESVLPAINYGKIFHFLAKPWDNDEFLSAINDAIAQHNLIQENKRLNALTRRQNQELVEMNLNLEKRVEKRTLELSKTNEELTREIANKIQYEEQLNLAARVFDNAREGFIITDQNNFIRKVNKGFSQITGYSPEEAIGENPKLLKSGQHPPEFYKEMWDDLLSKGKWSGEIWNRRKNGEVFPEWINISVIKNNEGQVTNYISVFHDISDLKHTEDKIKHISYHDALTNLPNQELLKDRLSTSIQHCKRHNIGFAVVYIDLDDFRKINDVLGHAVGDRYLKKIAALLKMNCRGDDTVARLGGDEFVIILSNINSPEKAASHIRRIFSTTFSSVITIDENSLHIKCSAGIALYPDDGKNVETLIKHAGIAMQKAKEEGKNTSQLFTEEMNRKVNHLFSLENQLRQALAQREFQLYYQPKVNPKTGKIIGVEALLRWIKASGEMVPPFDFIPLAETTGLILPIGEWVIKEACRQAKKWHEQGHKINIAVNLSIRQFDDGNLKNFIFSCLKEANFPADYFEVEITESMLLKNREQIVKVLESLKRKGIKISIDDFGTGYSSLSYLSRLPIDALKIDRSFIINTPQSHDDSTITNTIISLAKGLNLTTIAEGVETQEQLDFLVSHSCDIIQGYYFSPPIPAKQVNELLNTNFNVIQES